jgi:hypothetical protein
VDPTAASVPLGGRDHRAVTVGPDFSVRVVDTANGQPITRPFQHTAPVTAVALGPGGTTLLVVCADSAVRVWDVESGQALTPPVRSPHAVTAGALSDDGRSVRLHGESAGSTWDVSPGDWSAADLLLLARLYQGQRLDRFGALIPLTPDEVRTVWQQLSTRHPDEFRVPPAQALAWRLVELAACAAGQNWPGAGLHLDALLTETVGDWRAPPPP